MAVKFLSADEAVKLIKTGDTLAVSGSGVMNVVPEELLKALGQRFKTECGPRNITLFHPQGIGDRRTTGLGNLAIEGLLRRVIGGHWGMAPLMGKLAFENKIEAYNFPQGVMAQLLRATAARSPGIMTKIGLHTFIDPRLEGGKMNSVTNEDLVEVTKVNGEEWLFYKTIPINAAFIRGTTADEDGYISLEEEVHYDEVLAMSAAAKTHGGWVIAQVKRVALRGTLDPRFVKVPGFLVDAVVVVENQRQCYEYFYNPAYSGQLKQPIQLKLENQKVDERKVIARRQAMELKSGMVVNIGVGISNLVPYILEEEKVAQYITFSIEQGESGGMPAIGLDAGSMANPRIIVDHPSEHDLYHGGALDATCLSGAEIDEEGNVNVSSIDSNIPGAGGFIDISQGTKKIVFGGTFTAKGKVEIADGKVKIIKEGSIKKFVKKVKQITFSGKYAQELRQEVHFISERAVFKLTPKGIILMEIAPGVDLEKDILGQMEFKPLLSESIKEMEPRLFQEGPMDMRKMWGVENE